jgi:hypothetical protein
MGFSISLNILIIRIRMGSKVVEKTGKSSRSFIVTQKTGESITVQKIVKNTSYEVELLVFDQREIEELAKIQAEVYSVSPNEDLGVGDRINHLLHRLLNK